MFHRNFYRSKSNTKPKSKYFVSLFLANGWFWISHLPHFYKQCECSASSNAFSSSEFCTWFDLYIFELIHISINFPVEWNLWHIIIWTWWVSVQYLFFSPCNRWDNYVKYWIYIQFMFFILFWFRRLDLNDMPFGIGIRFFISRGNLLDHWRRRKFDRITVYIYFVPCVQYIRKLSYFS